MKMVTNKLFLVLLSTGLIAAICLFESCLPNRSSQTCGALIDNKKYCALSDVGYLGPIALNYKHLCLRAYYDSLHLEIANFNTKRDSLYIYMQQWNSNSEIKYIFYRYHPNDSIAKLIFSYPLTIGCADKRFYEMSIHKARGLIYNKVIHGGDSMLSKFDAQIFNKFDSVYRCYPAVRSLHHP
jgi:hypothetical protein